MVETLLTKKDAAERLRVSERTIDRLRARKKLRCVLVGAQVRFRPADLESYLSKSVQVA